LLEAIAVNAVGEDLAETLQMSRKQFYSRVAKLIKVDLIRRRHRKYILTPFGKLIYSVQISLSKAVENRWKFKAIDSVRDNKQLSPRQYLGMINLLLDDMELKELIFNKRR
jgi:predicted transcriptional regulator